MATQVTLLGKGELAVRVADWFAQTKDFELEWVVPVMPEPTWTSSLAGWAREHDVPVVESGHYRDLPSFASGSGPELAFSVFYDKILPASFIDSCDRILNLHNGPLPRYRGVSPINWALKNEERRHGVTIHEITPGVDDGPIVSQVTYSIYPEVDEVRDVYARALEFGFALFAQTMPMLDRITPQEQDHHAATYYSSQDDERLGDRRDFTRAISGKDMVT
jgi:methionyl-tRNA formyltransferase